MKYDPTNYELNLVDSNNVGILNIPDTEFESKVNLLNILLNTQEGELVMNHEFGINLTSLSFELYNYNNNEAFEFQLINLFKTKANQFVPEFQLIDLESHVESNFSEKNGSIIVKILWIYNNKFKFNTLSVIKQNNKFATILSNVDLYDDNTQEPKDVITKKMLINIVNDLKIKLATKELQES